MHVNLLWEDEASGANIDDAAAELARFTLSLGGTVSGEHGIGTLKRSFLADELGSVQLGLQQAIRRQWDPRGILNPGKLFPPA